MILFMVYILWAGKVAKRTGNYCKAAFNYMDAVSFVTASPSSVYTMAIENVTKQHKTMEQLCCFLYMAFKVNAEYMNMEK